VTHPPTKAGLLLLAEVETTTNIKKWVYFSLLYDKLSYQLAY